MAEREKRPDMTGENLELVYSDSARIKYRVLAPEYIKVNRQRKKSKYTIDMTNLLKVVYDEIDMEP